MLKNFNDIKQMKQAGFVGYKTKSELFVDSSCIPKIKGVYLILYLSKKSPEFLNVGTGGHFKKRNPNVSLSELKKNWVDNAKVIYVGRAGSNTAKATLNSRLKQYLKFGQGKNVGHWGGRLIWQLKNCTDLVVCWKELPNEVPREVEETLIQSFSKQFGKRPFANLCD